jgi:hypothetical protein
MRLADGKLVPIVTAAIVTAFSLLSAMALRAQEPSSRRKPPEPVQESSSVPLPQPTQEARPAPKPAARPPQPVELPAEVRDRIVRCVRDLDAPEFLAREAATTELLRAGPAVLPLLRPVLTGGSLEATSRALFIVRQVGLAVTLDSEDQAGQLLQELAEHKETPAVARRAAATLAELNEQRSSHALDELEQLGARISRSAVAAFFVGDDGTLSIEIGDAFRGQEQDLRRLKWITDVPVLILSGKQVTDGWVQQATLLPALEQLHVYQAKITDQGLEPLAGHAGLKQVGIYHTSVHDAVLKPLQKLPLLGFLKLYGTQVTKDGKEEFERATGVAVDFRRGAFLGVGGHDDPDACRISTVHRLSPADKAGILPGDVVSKFGGAAVRTFSDLTDKIAPHEFGDEVEIELLREDPTTGNRGAVTVKVTLGAWEVETAVQNRRR